MDAAACSTSLPTMVQVRDATVGPLFGHVARVGCRHLDVVVPHAEGVGRDLREDGARPLADLGARGEDAHAPVGRPLGADDRREVLLARAGEPGAVQECREPHAPPHRARRARSPRRSGRAWRSTRSPRARGRASPPMSTSSRTTCPVASVWPWRTKLRRRSSSGDEAELRGDLVQVPLEREERLRRTEAAEGAVRGRVGRDGARPDADVVDVVGPGGVDAAAREDDLRQRRVRAAVDDEVDVERDDLARRASRPCGDACARGGAWSSPPCPRRGRRRSSRAARSSSRGAPRARR